MVKTIYWEGDENGNSEKVNPDGQLIVFRELREPQITGAMMNFNINAEGGNGANSGYASGGGAGGRIAVYCEENLFTGTMDVSGGVGSLVRQSQGIGAVSLRLLGGLLDDGGFPGDLDRFAARQERRGSQGTRAVPGAVGALRNRRRQRQRFRPPSRPPGNKATRQQRSK